jgi:hypothetical protein
MMSGLGETVALPPDVMMDRETAARRLLPLVELTSSATGVEVAGDPLIPSDLKTDSIDIYTNTLCHGAGSEGDDKLCDYCFLSSSQLKSRNMMSLESFDMILDWSTTEGSPITTVSLLGGEFALHPEAKKMIKRVYGAGLDLHIVTSGSDEFRELLEDDEIVRILRDESRHNLVAVSLDSLSEKVNDKHRGQDAAQKALATIKALNRTGGEIPFRINATVTRSAINGLYELYDFAQNSSAQAVLVHFPSTVGRGSRWQQGQGPLAQYLSKSEVPRDDIPYAFDQTDGWGEWSDAVQWAADVYNKRKITRPGFRVECEDGYGSVRKCYMLERSTSLQFLPQISSSNLDMPVVACGLNMATANTESAYILRNGGLYQRGGSSELTRARDGMAENRGECPLQIDTRKACIYDRLGSRAIEEA